MHDNPNDHGTDAITRSSFNAGDRCEHRGTYNGALPARTADANVREQEPVPPEHLIGQPSPDAEVC